MSEKTTKRKVVDWAGMEPHYRAGIKSLKELGAEYGVSDAAIVKHAKKEKWIRDLAGKINAKAEAKVSAAAVSASVSANRQVNENAVVEANAELIYKVRMSHRKDIARTRNLFSALMDELELETSNKELFESLGEMLDKSHTDESGKEHVDRLNQIYQKVISMAGRVDNAKKLTEILEKVVKLEREAFGIKDAQESSNPIDELLKKINQEVA